MLADFLFYRFVVQVIMSRKRFLVNYIIINDIDSISVNCYIITQINVRKKGDYQPKMLRVIHQVMTRMPIVMMTVVLLRAL